jgi:hypothetical protein
MLTAAGKGDNEIKDAIQYNAKNIVFFICARM